MISNKFLKKIFTLTFILLLALVLTSVLFCLLPRISNPGTMRESKTAVSAPTFNSLDKSDNNFPFPLSLEQINKSLTQNQEIVITPVKLNWPEEINSSLLKGGWKLIGSSHMLDGGSVVYYYFETKDKPAMSLYYHWDLLKGNFQSLKLNFIHPARIGSWLIKNRPYFENSDIDIEALMDCEGILYETHPNVTECVKK